MLFPPGAIVFVNNDLVVQVRDFIVKQLRINEYMDGYVFDERIAADSTYPDKLYQSDQRIMVIRPFTELINRELADVVIFCKSGMAAVEKNKFGPPRPAFPIKFLHWNQLGIR